MPINPTLLIAAPSFQEALVDKNGTPMSGGTVTCFVDKNRTTLKNWYYQSSNTADAEGNYSFSRLPNPLTLSAAGTVCDINGVDTIPFFYPFNEANENEPQKYYITIQNYDQTNQITRPNFPYNTSGDDIQTTDYIQNYIFNNVFWRNFGTQTPAVDVLDLIVAPSQHDGFRFPDIQFRRNIGNTSDTITFEEFSLSENQILTNDITPEYYINHTCTSAVTGENFKCYQFPISLHVITLNDTFFTVTIQARNNGGTTAEERTISLKIFQDLGTGVTSPAPVLIEGGEFALTSDWVKYVAFGRFPSVAPNGTPVVLSEAGDDALYLQVQLPVDVLCDIDFTKPSLYLTEDVVPTNNFSTYDEIDSIINTPRTGDIRTSINAFNPFGWVAMNDGTIGYNPNPGSPYYPTARNDQDTWPLFNLIWTTFNAYNSGSSNPLAQMYDSAGTPVTYGASSYADWTANKAVALTKMMGRVIMGTANNSAVPLLSSYTSVIVSATSGTSSKLLVTLGLSGNYYNGCPIYFLNSSAGYPGNITPYTVYYVSEFNGTNQFYLANSFGNALLGFTNLSGLIDYSSAGSGQTSVNYAWVGFQAGEYAHTQLARELVEHTHNPAAGNSNFLMNGGSAFQLTATGAYQNAALTGGVTGYSTLHPMNTTQPATFYNMYIKL